MPWKFLAILSIISYCEIFFLSETLPDFKDKSNFPFPSVQQYLPGPPYVTSVGQGRLALGFYHVLSRSHQPPSTDLKKNVDLGEDL